MQQTHTQSADVFSFENVELEFSNKVENLALDADPIEQIRQDN